MIDDHMKYNRVDIWGVIGDVETKVFDIYIGINSRSSYLFNYLIFLIINYSFFHIVRTIAWFLAIIPVCILLLTCKLTLIPVLFLHSLDPEHASRHSFYSPLFQFLSLNKPSLRLHVANKFFLQCRKEQWR
jgi:hypothetical protein